MSSKNERETYMGGQNGYFPRYVHTDGKSSSHEEKSYDESTTTYSGKSYHLATFDPKTRISIDGIDVLNLGAFEFIKTVNEFGEQDFSDCCIIVKQSVSCREVLSMENMNFNMTSSFPNVDGDYSPRRWIAVIPQGKADDLDVNRNIVANECSFKTYMRTLLIQKKFIEAIDALKEMKNTIQNKHDGDLQHLLVPIDHNIGNIFLRLGNFRQAIKYFQLAKTGWKVLGDAEQIIVCLNKEGLAWFGIEELVHASSRFNEAAELCKHSQGTTQSLGKILSNLGCVLYKIGKVKESMNLFLRASLMSKAKRFSESQSIVLLDHSIFLGNYACAALKLKKFHLSEAPLKAAISLQRKFLDESNYLVQKMLENLAYFESKMENPCFETYEKLLLLNQNKYGATHVKTALVMGKLSIAHISAGNYDKAIFYLRGQLMCQEANLSPGHPDVLDTRNTIQRLEKIVRMRNDYKDQQLYVETLPTDPLIETTIQLKPLRSIT